MLFFFLHVAFLKASSDAGGVVVPASHRSAGRSGRMRDLGSSLSARSPGLKRNEAYLATGPIRGARGGGDLDSFPRRLPYP